MLMKCGLVFRVHIVNGRLQNQDNNIFFSIPDLPMF